MIIVFKYQLGATLAHLSQTRILLTWIDEVMELFFWILYSVIFHMISWAC